MTYILIKGLLSLQLLNLPHLISSMETSVPLCLRDEVTVCSRMVKSDTTEVYATNIKTANPLQLMKNV